MKKQCEVLCAYLILSFLAIGFVSCNKHFKKDYIDNFDPNGRCEELKIDSIAKQKATYEWAMEQLNEEYAERKQISENNIFSSSNSALGWLSGSRTESYFEYLAHLITYDIFLNDESLKHIEEYEAKEYNNSSVLKAKKRLDEYISFIEQFRCKLVLSPLIESSRGKNYIIYNVSFENSDVHTRMTIKISFDDKGIYTYWEEI